MTTSVQTATRHDFAAIVSNRDNMIRYRELFVQDRFDAYAIFKYDNDTKGDLYAVVNLTQRKVIGRMRYLPLALSMFNNIVADSAHYDE